MPVSAGDLIASILPQAPLNSGALPFWIAFSTVLGVFNTVQCFISPKLSKRVYSRKPQQGGSMGDEESCPVKGRLMASDRC